MYLQFLTSSGAVTRHSVPVNQQNKNEQAKKRSTIKYPAKVHIRSEAPLPHIKQLFKAPSGLDDTELEIVGHVTKKKKRSESKKKRKREISTNEKAAL